MSHYQKYKLITQMADVIGGYSPKPSERLPAGTERLLNGRNIGDKGLVLLDKDNFINVAQDSKIEKRRLQTNDIILTLLFEERKLYIYKESDPHAVATSSLAIIRPQNDLYIRDYLNTAFGRQRFLQETARQMQTAGRHISRITVPDLRQIRIPVLSPEELQEYVQSQQHLLGNKLLSLIAKGESINLEFKSTLRKNLWTGEDDPKMEDAVLKTIAAFCNSDGGTLLIGVDDSGSIIGIENDNFKNLDKFSLHLTNLIGSRLKPEPVGNIKFEIQRHADQHVCVVDCKPHNSDVWMEPKSSKETLQLYVRVGPSSKALEGPEISRYIRSRFSQTRLGKMLEHTHLLSDSANPRINCSCNSANTIIGGNSVSSAPAIT